MNFKLINEFDGDLHHQLYEFFKKSKPMNFCSIASPTIRNKKINEYINFLESCEIKYLIKSNLGEEYFIALQNENIKMNIIFIMNISLSNSHANDSLNEFYKFIFKQYPKCEYVYSSISRKFKLQKYLSWIKRYAKSCKVEFDNDKIVAYWYKTHVE